VPRLLRKLSGAFDRLTGAGALDNARFEIDRAKLSIAELDAQLARLERLPDPSPRRAA
jgi:hypothetical protein